MELSTKKNTALNVSKAVSLLTFITLISKVLGLLREVGVASRFGVGTKTDAFYVALIIPTLIFTSIGIALQNLFMAEFASFKVNHSDKNMQSTFISKMINILLIISFILTIISLIASPLLVKIVAPGFIEPYKYSLTVKLTNVLLPTMIIIPIIQIKASVLRVYDRFVVVAITDLLFNIFQLIYLFLFVEKYGIIGLAVSIVCSYLFQFIILEILLYKQGLKYKLIIDFKDKYIRNVFRLFFPTMVSFGIIQVNALVDKIIASNLDDGSVSALNYGFMVRNLSYNIIVLSILTVIYPKLLDLIANSKLKEFHSQIKNTIKIFLLILFPMTVLMLIFCEPIIKIIFERGEFSSSDTIITSKVLFFYTLGIIPFSLKEFFVRVSYTYKNTHLPLIITFIGSILNIIFSIILKQFMGVNGIALGLSISEIICLFIFIYFLGKKKYISYEKDDKIMVLRIILINIIFIFINVLIVLNRSLPQNTIYLIVYLFVYVLVYLLMYNVLCYLFKIDTIIQLNNELFKKLFKRGRNNAYK